MHEAGVRIDVEGTVQGVGFRPWVYRVASGLGLRGSIHNGTTGVTIEAFGPQSVLQRFLDQLRGQGPVAAEIRALHWRFIDGAPGGGFSIEPSTRSGPRRAVIPADLPTCTACLAEIHDPGDRRYRYAFTNCTDCGPRFTIAREVPYDRVNTSMQPFAMCGACRAEYGQPASRRFHAEANSCPACGPRLRLLDCRGLEIETADPLRAAATALASGSIIAVKGLGGYHLACDAGDRQAVVALRARKRRDAKPFAVMVPDLASAAGLVVLDEAERRLLLGAERPIVLARRRPAGAIAAAVAPGCERLGLFLPYTPLHHLLLEDVGRPLVMTSANCSDEPSVYRDRDALERLAGIADLFLSHDREIVTRTDDSVALVLDGRPAIVRRSRGYVPHAFALPDAGGPVVLGCGAHLKNTFCLASGDAAYLGPHIGDLDNLEALASYTEAIERMQRFLSVRPEVVAHDLHPDYFSTRYALERADAVHVAVQHHHAHAVAAMIEHDLSGPVLALVWDGTGLGSDGASWGGELLLADRADFRRLATLRPIRLAGGDSAVRQVWRQALAALDDAFDGDPPLDRLVLFQGVDTRLVNGVRRMIAAGVNTTAAHGVGRWFDAVGAIGLGMTHAAYEGQVAVCWEQAAGKVDAEPLPFDVADAGEVRQLDLRPALRTLVERLLAGVDVGELSAGFHETLVAGAASLLADAFADFGHLPVVLAGGCFYNERLVRGMTRRLPASTEVYRCAKVPCGDGGLALGQVGVARARLAQAAGSPAAGGP